MHTPAQLLLDARAQLGEGALWDARRQQLLWIDILGQALHLFDPATGTDRVLPVGQLIGTIVPRTRGGAVVALRNGLHAIDLENGQLQFLYDPETDRPNNRFNDGKCDPQGRLWAGTMSCQDQPNQGTLWRFDPDGNVHPMLAPVSISNGIAWSRDQRTLYYIDTPTGRVDAFNFTPATGTIANRRPCIRLEPGTGHPDGSTLDAEGMLWIAHWDGGCVTRWDPRTGRCLQRIPVPASRVTSCAFGGPALDQLFITTARVGLSPEQLRTQPHAGGLFCVRPGVSGLAANEFAG